VNLNNSEIYNNQNHGISFSNLQYNAIDSNRIHIDSVYVHDNDGSGIEIRGGLLHEIKNSIIENNNGEGIYIFECYYDSWSWNDGYQGKPVTISDCIVRGNTGRGVSIGGAAHINNTTIKNNGGGVNIYPSDLSALIEDKANQTLITNTEITHNIASGWDNDDGGGIRLYLYNSALYISALKLESTTIAYNTAEKGGGIYFGGTEFVYGSSSASQPIEYSVENPANIYLNNADEGADLFEDVNYLNYDPMVISVELDTFTVANPTEYHASPLEHFDFNIQNGKVEPSLGPIFVSPTGSDNNDGLSPETPLKRIGMAVAMADPDTLNQIAVEINIMEGQYGQSFNGENFPIFIKDYGD